MLKILALDIGGANIKAVHSRGAVSSRPFALWKDPAGLGAALQTQVQELPAFDLLAVTMTGELCDCFATKRQGVNAILDAAAAVAANRPVRVWQTTGSWVDVATARAAPLATAAANWLALATYAGRFVPAGPGLVLDIGSTTTDIIPLLDGRPIPEGRTDPERLRSHELVYCGVRRTPVCALLGSEGAAELFATTRDVYLVLGQLPEDVHDRSTADGRPATRQAARARLARMICADAECCTDEEIHGLALRVHDCQLQWLQHALALVAGRFPGPPRAVVLAGSGEFLARALLDLPSTRQRWSSPLAVISLEELLGPALSEAACAHALAVLAAEF